MRKHLKLTIASSWDPKSFSARELVDGGNSNSGII